MEVKKSKPLMVTPKKNSGRYKIQGRTGRFDGETKWETKNCYNCPAKADASTLSENVVGVCTASKFFKVIIKSHSERRIRLCEYREK